MNDTQTVKVDSTELARIVRNVAPFAGKDSALPALYGVRFETSAGRLEVITTDRYRIGVDSAPLLEGQEQPSFTLPSESVTALLGILKSSAAPKGVKEWPVTVTLEDGAVTFETVTGIRARYFTTGADFPKWRALFPEQYGETPSVGRIGINPTQLVPFSKVLEEGRTKPSSVMRCYFTGETKPVLVEIGDTFRGLIMPVRIDWPAVTSSAAAA